LKNKGRCL